MTRYGLRQDHEQASTGILGFFAASSIYNMDGSDWRGQGQMPNVVAPYQSVIVLNHEWSVIRHWQTCDGVVHPSQYATATAYYYLIGSLYCEHGTLMHVSDHGITMQVQITARHWNEPMTYRQHHVVGCRYIASRPLNGRSTRADFCRRS